MRTIKNVKVKDNVRINGKRYTVVAVYPYHIRVKEINSDSLIDKFDTFNYGDLVMNGLEDSGYRGVSMEEMIDKYGEHSLAS